MASSKVDDAQLVGVFKTLERVIRQVPEVASDFVSAADANNLRFHLKAFDKSMAELPALVNLIPDPRARFAAALHISTITSAALQFGFLVEHSPQVKGEIARASREASVARAREGLQRGERARRREALEDAIRSIYPDIRKAKGSTEFAESALPKVRETLLSRNVISEAENYPSALTLRKAIQKMKR